MAQFVGFMMNMISGEEFLAPVDAETREEAFMQLEMLYPGQGYTTLTLYPRSELNVSLSSLDRWPGLPSKVQQPLESLLSRVTAQKGGLPPLKREATSTSARIPAVDGATVSAVKSTPLQTAPKPVADFSSLRAPASAHGRAVEPEADVIPEGSAIAALRALRSGQSAGMSLGASAPAAPAPRAEAPQAAQPRSGSLIAVLKSMKH
jgi:hypothetical protein